MDHRILPGWTACAILLTLSAGPVLAAFQNPPKAPWQDLSTDRPASHVQVITSGQQAYPVTLGGHIDGTMTRMPISYAAYVQGWQPNRWVRLENVGETDVVNPWLTANGLGDWRTVDKIVAEATRGCRTPAEKARALWEWERNYRYHACTWDSEVSDAVKAANVYGYTLCGDDCNVLSDLFLAAGLNPRRAYPVGHGVTEAFYDGDYHLLDGDEHVICLRRDNKTLASEEEIVRDHDLMKRTHTYSIGSGDSTHTDEFSVSLYGYEGKREGRLGGYSKATMLFTLRPGEALEWRFSHAGKEYSNGKSPDPGTKNWTDGDGQLLVWGNTAYDNLRNGKWTYRPPLDRVTYRPGVLSEDNIACRAEDHQSPNLHPREPLKPARVTWKIASPYVIVGGSVDCTFRRASEADHFKLSFSVDGKTWQALAEDGPVGLNHVQPVLDKLVSPRGQPTYQYFVQAEMQGNAAGSVGLEEIIFDNDVQMSLLGMPELRVGSNDMLYTDETKGPRTVRITHSWMERSAWQPPSAPAQALFPAPDATVEGTRVTFKWSPAQSPDPAAKVVDYQIQVCDRPDMRWVISPNFDKLLSGTPSRGQTQWTVPFTGLLNPDTPYYWRVRAKDNRGVWGPWSEGFSFKCAAPGVPLNLKAVPDAARGTVDLTWDTNPEGRKPVAFKIYGSNEQGFTISDTEYVVYMGNGFCDTMDQFTAKPKTDPFFGDVKTPANLVTRTDQRRLTVVGPGLSLPNTNRAFYRVVAIDSQGNESEPSDLLAVPRPWVTTVPQTLAKIGQAYRYEPAAIFSIGHLTCRGGYNPAFWQREKLTWELTQGPAWLKVEEGALVGTPGQQDNGAVNIVLKVTNNRGQSAEQRFSLTITP